MWLFGYGSLIFRPSFTFVERREAWINGWERRFFQGSPDHRGTPAAPGRVVTLLPVEGAWCAGVAYRLEAWEAARVLAEVDVREQAGFERCEVSLHAAPASTPFASGTVYVASATNAHYLGPASAELIAAHVARSAGPSGSNTDYVLRLAAALREMGASDPHVEEVAERLARVSIAGGEHAGGAGGPARGGVAPG
jgi:cation transport protein ChaC